MINHKNITMKYININRKVTALLFILMTFSTSLNAQWNIPKEAKNSIPPVEATYKTVEEGKVLFQKNCISCHGIPGKGENNKAINATDLGDESYQLKHTVGEVFYQFNTGMGAMPSFKNRFSEEEKWHIAFYVKSFDNSFKISGERIKTLNANLKMSINDSDKTIKVTATVTDDNGSINAAANTKINFYVKRIFGNMPVSEDIKTNEDGIAVFKFPDDIPGDEKGKIKIIAGFEDTDRYGKNTETAEVTWGKVLHYENPNLKRTLWGSNKRVPVWLLITYLSVTLGVWFVIFYVAFQITRIKNAGK